VIRYPAGEKLNASTVGRALSITVLDQATGIPPGHVRVFLGANYTGPGAPHRLTQPVADPSEATHPAQSAPPADPPITAGGVACVN
jgi:hypothetical protein